MQKIDPWTAWRGTWHRNVVFGWRDNQRTLRARTAWRGQPGGKRFLTSVERKPKTALAGRAPKRRAGLAGMAGNPVKRFWGVGFKGNKIKMLSYLLCHRQNNLFPMLANLLVFPSCSPRVPLAFLRARLCCYSARVTHDAGPHLSIKKSLTLVVSVSLK